MSLQGESGFLIVGRRTRSLLGDRCCSWTTIQLGGMPIAGHRNLRPHTSGFFIDFVGGEGMITILIADDEKEIADLVEFHLEKEGYQIIKD